MITAFVVKLSKELNEIFEFVGEAKKNKTHNLMLLPGKAAVVTGAAQGIGRAVAEALLQRCVKVCLTDVNIDELESMSTELKRKYGADKVMFAKCDVSCHSEFEKVLIAAKEKFGHLDILINNAGIGGEKKWDKVIEINLIGVIRGTTLALEHLQDETGAKGGTVINTASILGLKISPHGAAYCASKQGVVAWSRCIGDESRREDTNVRVNAICPSVVDTQMWADLDQHLSMDKKAFAAIKEQLKGTEMTPAYVAEGYIKVLEDDVSGAALVIKYNEPYTYYQFSDIV